MGDKGMARDRTDMAEGTGKAIDANSFRGHIEYAIENCYGGGYEVYDSYGYPCCPVTIFLERVKVPVAWTLYFSNIRATHSPVKDKLLEFVTPQQLGVLVKIEELYINCNKVDDGTRTKMRKLLDKEF